MASVPDIDPEVADLLESGYRALGNPTDVGLAVELLTRALASEAITADEMVTAYVGLAQAALFANDLDAGVEAAEALVVIGRECALLHATATGLTISGQIELARGRPAEARTALTTVLREFRRALLPEQAAAAWWMLAEIHILDEDLGPARRALTRAARVCRRAKLVGDLARVEVLRARVAILAGRPHDALRRADGAARRARTAGDAYRSAQAERAAATACHRLGRLGRAAALAARAATTFRAVGDLPNLGRVLFESAQILIASGRFTPAEQALSESIRALRTAGAVEELAHALMLTAQLDQLRGRPDHALATLAEVAPLLHSVGRADAQALVLRSRGAVLLQLGRATEAVELYREGVKLARETPFREARAHVLHGFGAALLGSGRPEDAAEALLLATEEHIGVGLLAEAAASHRVRASALLALERWEEALAAVDQALDLARRAGDRPATADARAVRAVARFRSGRVQGARRDAALARRAFLRLGQFWNLAVMEGNLAVVLLARDDTEAAEQHAVAALRWLDRFSSDATRITGHADLLERFQRVQAVVLTLLRRRGRPLPLIERVETTRAATLQLLLPQARTHPTEQPLRRGSVFKPRSRDLGQRVEALLDGAHEHASRGGVTLAWYPEAEDGTGELLLVSPEHGAWFFRDAVSHARVRALVGGMNEEAVLYDPARWTALLGELRAELLDRPLGEAVPIRVEGGARPRSVAEVLRAHPMAPLEIIPHGVLHLVPWSALPMGERDRPLVRDHLVRLLPRLPSRSRLAPSRPRRALVFSQEGHGLVGVREEAARVARTLRAAGFDVIEFGAERPLSVEALRAEGPGVDILHLATHAVFDAEAPWRSWIQLSPRPGSVEGERLTLEGLLDLGVAPDTVVLSACSTALVDRGRLFDPVSLAHGFLGLGTRTVVGTLWQVRDLHMVDLLAEVYRHAIENGWRWDEAVRAAVLQRLDERLPDPRVARETHARRGFLGKAEARVVPGGPSPASWAALQVLVAPGG